MAMRNRTRRFGLRRPTSKEQAAHRSVTDGLARLELDRQDRRAAAAIEQLVKSAPVIKFAATSHDSDGKISGVTTQEIGRESFEIQALRRLRQIYAGAKAALR
jgi:hypothetical protein